MFQRFKNLGPGVLVAAAFIGPGTVTACTLSGAHFGYTLLWALLFATCATIVLQEMSARLGIMTGQGLGDALRTMFAESAFRWPMMLLLLIALAGGNAAYEGGNIAGAALGLEAILGEGSRTMAVLALAGFAGIALWLGSYKVLEKILIALVLLMSVAFVAAFVVVKPDLMKMVAGMFSPRVTQDNLMTVMALVGTTIVPYNLFLHASAVKDKWRGEGGLNAARIDTSVSIGLGGLVAILIAATAAASMFAQGLTVTSAADMAVQLEPLFGASAKYMLGLGLFAAGLSSAITAPLATSYVVTEIFGWERQQHGLRFKAIGLVILLIGTVLCLTGIKPVQLIVMAQIANGLLLPVIACFLIYAMNQKKLLGERTNGVMANVFGVVVVLLTTLLGVRLVLKAAGVW